MKNANHPIVKIPIDGRRKKLTPQTIHDNEKLNLRMIENKQRLQIIDKKMINKNGKKMTMNELFDIAQTISKITNRKIDRLARRNRNGLLCWLAESCDFIANMPAMGEIGKKIQENNLNTINDQPNITNNINPMNPTCQLDNQNNTTLNQDTNLSSNQNSSRILKNIKQLDLQ